MKHSVKNVSLLSLVLMATSIVTAALATDKSNSKRINNGTLRIFSATLPGADLDAPEASVSCIAILSAASCTATAPSETTTNYFLDESFFIIGEFYYHTIGNTSQTANIGGDQNSLRASIS